MAETTRAQTASGVAGVLCTHFENTEEVCRFVEHLNGQPTPDGWSVEIVVVDNSGTLEAGCLGARNVHVCRPGSNLGYFNGCSYGLKQLRGMLNGLPDWLVVTNTDVAFDGRFFRQLLREDWARAVGVVAPAVRAADGLAQNPFLRERPSRRRIGLYAWIFRWPTLAALYWQGHRLKRKLCARRAGRRRARTPEAPEPIYAAHGSVVCLRRAFFERGGTLAYGGFLYGEEIHIAEQARRQNLTVVWDPALQVAHQEEGPTTRALPAQLWKWHHESLCFLYKTYFSSDAGAGGVGRRAAPSNPRTRLGPHRQKPKTRLGSE